MTRRNTPPLILRKGRAHTDRKGAPPARSITVAELGQAFDGLLEDKVGEAEFNHDPFDAIVRESWEHPETDCEYCGGSGLTTEGDCGCTA